MNSEATEEADTEARLGVISFALTLGHSDASRAKLAGFPQSACVPQAPPTAETGLGGEMAVGMWVGLCSRAAPSQPGGAPGPWPVLPGLLLQMMLSLPAPHPSAAMDHIPSSGPRNGNA